MQTPQVTGGIARPTLDTQGPAPTGLRAARLRRLALHVTTARAAVAHMVRAASMLDLVAAELGDIAEELDEDQAEAIAEAARIATEHGEVDCDYCEGTGRVGAHVCDDDCRSSGCTREDR